MIEDDLKHKMKCSVEKILFVLLIIYLNIHKETSTDMKLETSCFNELCATLKNLDIGNSYTYALELYKSTIRKSKNASNGRFLRRCLHKNVIPHGFRLKFHGFVNFEQTLKNCSKQLMRKTLKEIQRKGIQLSKEIENVSDLLYKNCDKIKMREIKFKIHCLNSKIFDNFEETKYRKFANLSPANLDECVNKEFDENDVKLVVTIPADLELSDIERSVLRKGLKFVPTRSPNKVKMEEDLEEFYRRLRLHAHFNLDLAKDVAISLDLDDSTDNYFNKFEMKSKGSWCPSEGESRTLDTFIHTTRSEIEKLDLKWKSKYNNMSVAEKKALNNLRSRDDIVIKQADKGGATVVWSKEMYITEGLRQLSDDKFYIKLEEDITNKNNDQVKCVVEDEIRLKNLCNESKSLSVKKPKCSKFYVLPKIHKPDYPTVGRPIVSNLNCPTEKISQFLDDIFQPIVKSLPSFVKDTTDFLRKIKDFAFDTDNDCNLFTMDVKSLYTVIDNNEGLKAVKYFLESRAIKEPPTCTIIRLTEMVLTLNCFSFNNEYYKQIGGVCMGTKMGPSYANLYMGYLEEKIFKKFTAKLPQLYLRYIDDIFCAGNMQKKEIDKFIDFFNTFDDSIKVTAETGISVCFLDTKLNTKNRSIETNIYYKPTDSHTYLRYDSAHPRPCKNGIPYSQFLRLKKICSVEEEFAKQAKIMSSFFVKRGYPERIVKESLQKVNRCERNVLLENSSKSTTTRIPLVLTYNKLFKPATDIIYKNFSILQEDPLIGCLFSDPPMLAYKEDPNLKNILVHSSLKNKTENTEIPGTFTCQRNRCYTCFHTNNAQTITSSGGSFKIKKHFTCISTNVIYALRCAKCGDLYIGETERKLGDRFREHLRLVKKQFVQKSLVAQHFNFPDHSYTDMEISGLLHIENDNYRKIIEKRIIRQLQTVYPLGMNNISK